MNAPGSDNDGTSIENDRCSMSKAEISDKEDKVKQGHGPRQMKYVNDRLVLADRGTFGSVEDVYEKVTNFCFGWVPLFHSAFKWHKPSVRNAENENTIVEKPGLFTLRNIYDAMTFQWLRYLEVDNFEDDNSLIIENVLNEQANLGLISALLLTVFTAFFQGAAVQYYDPPTDGNGNNPANSLLLLHMLLWLLATVSILLATIFSVFMYLGISEGKNELEKMHFLNLFDEYTSGLGSKFTLSSAYLSCVCGAVGLCVYIAINCGLYQLFYSLVVIGPVVFSFCLFYLQLTSCLYCARKTGTRIIMEIKGVQLSLSEVKNLLDEYVKSKHPSNEIADPNYLGPDDDVGDFLDFIKPEGSKLCMLTERRARRLFNKFIDANCFETVSVQQLDLNKNYGDKN